MQGGHDPFADFLREQTIRAKLERSNVGGGKRVMDIDRLARQMAGMRHGSSCVAAYVTALVAGDLVPASPTLH